MPSPEQDSSLQALVAGERPDEVIFDPITDNDSTGSCLGCAYSVLGSAGVLVGLYAASHRYSWPQAQRLLAWLGPAGLFLLFMALALIIFTAVEVFASKEVFVLDTRSRRLEQRQRKGQRVIKAWEVEQIRRFVLDPPVENPEAQAGLYVLLEGEKEPVRLLEACYPRGFVEQVERALAEVCEVLSTT